MTYNTISLCALKLTKNLPSQTYYVMSFPQVAKEYIKSFQSKLNKSQEKVNLPTKSLYKALHLMPGLIYISPISGKNTDEFWLYSLHELSTEKLSIILRYWLNTEFPTDPAEPDKSISEEEREEALRLLEAGLIWQSKTITYKTTFNVHKNNTADISSIDYILLPHIIANHLSQKDFNFQIEGNQLKFYRTVTSNNVQLIAWPPLNYVDKQKTYYYSIVLSLNLVLIPGQAYPQLHINPSIRRWISLPNSKLSAKHNTTSYILAKDNWIKSNSPATAKNQREVFLSCQMTWNKDYQWDENLGELLKQLKIMDIVPSDLLKNPALFLQGYSSKNKQKTIVAMTYKDGMSPNHEVAKTLTTNDTISLFKQISDLLSSHWQPIQYERIKLSGKKKISKIENCWSLPLPKSKKSKESEDNYQLTFDGEPSDLGKIHDLLEHQTIIRRAIARCIKDKHLTIWLWYIKEETLKERLKAIRYCFGLPDDCLKTSAENPYQYFCVEEEITFTIICKAVGDFAEPLDTTPRANSNKRQNAVNLRIKKIVDFVNANKHKISGSTVVWFELYEKDHWQSKQDPKLAIRLGFAQAGMVSQFIVPAMEKDKNYKYKAIKCIIDLLRALGVTLENPPLTLPQLNSPPITVINQVGLYLVNRTGKTTADGDNLIIPVIVRIDELWQITAIFPRINESDDGWQPYQQALLDINTEGKSYQKSSQDQGLIRNWIKKILNKKELRNKDTILYCESQNIRSIWKWLQDTNINQQGLSFAENKEQNFEQFAGLRLVRVRLKGNNETPEWFAEENDKKSAHITGLFQHPEKLPVFYSLPNKSPTMSGNRNNLSRIVEPGSDWKHPQIVEFTIGYHQENDNLESLAMIAHNSRKGILQYGDFLQLPQILHYAKLMKEYVLMLNSEDTENTD